jgi:CDP-diacylglycerol--glycerol-3-phosphate 3-phosphatidyltransferase
MVLQCGAEIAILVMLLNPENNILEWTAVGFLWSAIALTVYSGVDYSRAAARVMHVTSASTDSQGE